MVSSRACSCEGCSMSRLVVDVFAEDRAHEEFLRPAIFRIAAEAGVEMSLRVRSARGGHVRAVAEFKLYQDVLDKGVLGENAPDLIVVGIDGNCSTFARKRQEILDAARPALRDRLVVACPDPHVERWYVADPNSFHTVVGHRPEVGAKKCARDHYKNVLSKSVRQAGHPATLGGIEFARELVQAMDLYRAGRNDHSLRAFVDDLRGKLQQVGNP